MASITGSSSIARPQPLLNISSRTTHCSLEPQVSFSKIASTKFNSVPLRFRISCAAKPDTVEKVSDIVKKQLALKDEQQITGETKFSDLGADSLDTVEIVMRLEEEFGVSVEEENAQTITTIGEAADMIEKLQH